MFKTSVTPSYTAVVNVDVLGDEGAIQTRVIKCRFKRKTQTEIDALWLKIGKSEISDDEIVKDALIGWEGPVDEEGNPIEFNAANLPVVLDVFPTRSSIVKKYLDTINFSRAKN